MASVYSSALCKARIESRFLFEQGGCLPLRLTATMLGNGDWAIAGDLTGVQSVLPLRNLRAISGS